MSENMSIYERARNVPEEALKPIQGGRLKGMSDINPMWRIKMLTELFGVCGIGWKVEITDKRLERGEGVEVVCFVDINLYVKVDGEWSAPIPGMGGSSFVTQERNGVFTNDECFKMAYTDAISVACKSLGFAADVYFANDRTKYTNNEIQENERQGSKNAAPAAPAVQRQPIQGGLNAKSRVMNLKTELQWDWNALSDFASGVLGRSIKKVIRDIQTDEEWIKVEQAMLVTKQAS